MDVLDRPSLEHLVDATVANARGVDGRRFLGHLGELVVEVIQRVALCEPRPREDDGVGIEMRECVAQFVEQLRPRAGVLSLARRSGERGVLLGAVLGDGVDVGLALLDGGDGDVGILGGRFGLLDSLHLVRLEVLLNRQLVVFLDVQRVMVAELVLPGTADDDAADPESVGEAGELHVLYLQRDVDVFAFTAGVAHLVVVPLDASAGVTIHVVAGFEDVRQVPEVVDVLRDDRQPGASLLAATTALDSHTGGMPSTAT